MFRKVVVGVDGQEGGRDAIALARLLLAADGGLTLSDVYTSDPYMYRGVSAGYAAVLEGAARELFERARSEAGLDAEVRWRGSSSPGRGLARTASGANHGEDHDLAQTPEA
jgi:hypothetical protein